MKNKNFQRYDREHWSETADVDLALEKYLNQYSDVYNSFNIERFVAQISSGTKQLRVLDYGGGCGMLACHVAKLGHKVTLADQSAYALSAAEGLAAKMGVSIDTLQCESAAGLPGEFFDVIFMKDLVEHVVDDAGLIKDIEKALKPLGLLCLSSQNDRSPNYWIEGGLRRLRNPGRHWMGWDRTHLRFYSPRKFRMLLGASQLQVESFDSAYIFPYKLVDLIPLGRGLRDKIYCLGFKFDRLLRRVPFCDRLGWNLMVVARKN